MSIWQYSDWDSDQFSDAEKLSRLKLHIAEMEEHNTSFAAKGDSIGAIPEATFARLEKTKERLQKRVDMASGRIGSGRNKVRFRRAT